MKKTLLLTSFACTVAMAQSATGELAISNLYAAVAADLEKPVRPGGVDGRPFWNVNGRGMRYVYPPAFDFAAVPGVAEKYTWSVVENSLTASMMRLYAEFYRLEGDGLCLAKARTLGDSIVRVQQICGDGEIASEWFSSYLIGSRCPHIWLNCSVGTVTKLEDAAAMLEKIAP